MESNRQTILVHTISGGNTWRRCTQRLHSRCKMGNKMFNDNPNLSVYEWVLRVDGVSLQYFLIVWMCRSFTEACSVVMTFED